MAEVTVKKNRDVLLCVDYLHSEVAFMSHVSSWYNEYHSPEVSPPKMEFGCLHGEVIENGRTRNHLTLWTVPALVTCMCTG